MAEKATDWYVLNVQKWVNDTYRGKAGYTEIPETGKTGWDTIYALLHGLQITLKVGSTANNFGSGTERAFNQYIKDYGKITEQEEGVKATGQRLEINGIIQGALLCKGYSIGTTQPTGQFYGGTASAIEKLKSDAGLNDTTPVVTLNLMKALLSMDYFYSYDTSERTQKIINIQRYLNRNYEAYIGIRPCDGIYTRRTSQAMLFAIQAEEGIPISDANGNCGPSTKRCLPTLLVNGNSSGTNYNGQAYSESSFNKFKILANMSLYFNGFGTGEISSSLSSTIINDFQSRYSIPVNGKIDYTTWLSLLISCGDTDRSAIACDCITKITNNNVSVLKNNNYEYIGRYLSNVPGGLDKELSIAELKVIFGNGIRLFPIHQHSADHATYFTEENALKDATSASEYANKLKLQFGAIIYFAVDYDATDAEITNKVLPYFKKLHSEFIKLGKAKYRVGVYGTRNLCTRVCNAGYACSSYVSDMSTGYSGNLGFPIPDNWALDQFCTTTISSEGKSIEIDKDGFSGRYKGISQEYSTAEAANNDRNTLLNSFVLANRSGVNIPVYASKERYLHSDVTAGTQFVPSGDKIGEIKPNDFYVFFGVSDPSYDTVHKVLFNDGLDVKMGYVDGEHEYPPISNVDLKQANYNQRPKYSEPYSCLRYDPTTGYTLVPATKNQVITINKPVVYFTTAGEYAGTLTKGDTIIISANNVNTTGNSMPWCYRVAQITFKDGTVSDSSKSYYVSVGLEYASSGPERAWY